MLAVLIDTWRHHDHHLLLVAAAIWVFASHSLFVLLQRSFEFGARRRRQWSVIAATTGGVGVWATHFVAMLAHHDGMPITYDAGLTIFSVVEVILFFWLALTVVEPARGLGRQMIAGFVAAAGVGLMHFTGMRAITSEITVHYALVPIAWAMVIACLCFVGSFVLFFRTHGIRQVVLPALLSIVAVCTLHFTAMSATTMTMGPDHHIVGAGLDRGWLITAILIATSLLVAATGVAMLLDRYLTDLRGLADATLEGLIIVQNKRIVEANARFADMLGIPQKELLGHHPGEWLVVADDSDLLAERDAPVEAGLSPHLAGDRSFEIGTHSIEYRGRDSLVLALRDLTEKKEAQRRIEHMARHDSLTDLPNRTLLDERLAHALALARREEQALAVIALDLDRFKAINDVFGHAAGDQVLCKVATILADNVRSTDTVARIGGDEFVIIQVGAAQPDGAQALVGRIFEAFAKDMDTARDPLAVGVSVGVAVFPNDATDADGLRHGADIALYRAKQSGRGSACFFDQEMDAAVRERRALEHELRHAVLRDQLHVAFQPLVCTTDRRISGYEALMRWSHPELGDIPPDVFVPIAEDTGAIVLLGEWILREACRLATRWSDDLFLAVNVSPVQFRVANLADTVENILAETGFPANRLELEITENVLMKDRESALEILTRLKRQGVRIVMDDFGTGYSSLSNLQSFPFDKIKIDRSFIGAMESDDAARSIIRAIVGIGRSLALPVVAEGVETEAQHRMVTEEGCPLAQGYLFGRPERQREFPGAAETASGGSISGR